MSTSIPPVASIRDRLAGLSHAQVQQLSRQSSVPFTTIWKIRDGTTENPGMETVRKFWAHVEQMELAPTPEPEARAA